MLGNPCPCGKTPTAGKALRTRPTPKTPPPPPAPLLLLSVALYRNLYEQLKREKQARGCNQHLIAFSSGAIAGSVAALSHTHTHTHTHTHAHTHIIYAHTHPRTHTHIHTRTHTHIHTHTRTSHTHTHTHAHTYARTLSAALYWTLYEQLKREQQARGYNQHLIAFSSGAIAGSVAAFVTTPFDVIKTYRQIDLSAGMSECVLGVCVCVCVCVHVLLFWLCVCVFAWPGQGKGQRAEIL